MRMKAYLLLLCTSQAIQAMDSDWLDRYYMHSSPSPSHMHDASTDTIPPLFADYDVMPTAYTAREPDHIFATQQPAEFMVLEELPYNGENICAAVTPETNSPTKIIAILQIPPPARQCKVPEDHSAQLEDEQLSDRTPKAGEKLYLDNLRALVGDQLTCDTRELEHQYAQNKRAIFLAARQRFIAQLLTHHGQDPRVQDLCTVLESDANNRYIQDSFTCIRSRLALIFKSFKETPSDILKLYRETVATARRANNTLYSQKHYIVEKEKRLLEEAFKKTQPSSS